MEILKSELQPYIIGRDHIYTVSIRFCHTVIFYGDLLGSSLNAIRTGIEKFLDTNGLKLGTMFHLTINGNDGSFTN